MLGRGRPYAGAFVGHLLDRLVFYSFPQWLFTMVYLSFGALVPLTFILAPPRLSGWKKSPSKMARAAIGSAAMNATASAGRTEPKVGIDGRPSLSLSKLSGFLSPFW